MVVVVVVFVMMMMKRFKLGRRKVIGDVRVRRGHGGRHSLSGCYGQNKQFFSLPRIDLKCKAIMYRSNLCHCCAMASWKLLMQLSLMLVFHLPSNKIAAFAHRPIENLLSLSSVFGVNKSRCIWESFPMNSELCERTQKWLLILIAVQLVGF